jgi:hypothetical protein
MIGTGVSIGTRIYDIDGDVEFLGVTNPADLTVTRRVTNTPTLNGGSFVMDTGYSDTDRLFDYVMSGELITKEYVDNIVRIAKSHSRLFLCIAEGVFEVIIKSVFYANGNLRVSMITVGGLS